MVTSFRSLDLLNPQMDIDFWGAWFYDRHSPITSDLEGMDSFGAYIGGGEL